MAKKGKYYPIEEIVDQRTRNGKLEYFIKWKGYSSVLNSWEPKKNVKKVFVKERVPKRTSSRTSRTTKRTSTKAAPRTTKRTSITAASRKSNRISAMAASRTTKTTSTNSASHSTKRTSSTDAAPRRTTKSSVSTKTGTTKQSSTEMSTENANDDEFFNIERILAKRIVNNKIHYLVQWKGYGTDESTWEPEDRLKDDYRKNLFNHFKNAFV